MGAVARRGAAGISLVGVCAAVATVGVLTVVVAAAVPRWTAGAHESADVSALRSLLRDTQQEAMGDGRPRCVEAETFIVLRRACAPGRAGVTFFGDGSVTPGTFRVGSGTVTVDSSGSTAVT